MLKIIFIENITYFDWFSQKMLEENEDKIENDHGLASKDTAEDQLKASIYIKTPTEFVINGKNLPKTAERKLSVEDHNYSNNLTQIYPKESCKKDAHTEARMSINQHTSPRDAENETTIIQDDQTHQDEQSKSFHRSSFYEKEPKSGAQKIFQLVQLDQQTGTIQKPVINFTDDKAIMENNYDGNCKNNKLKKSSKGSKQRQDYILNKAWIGLPGQKNFESNEYSLVQSQNQSPNKARRVRQNKLQLGSTLKTIDSSLGQSSLLENFQGMVIQQEASDGQRQNSAVMAHNSPSFHQMTQAYNENQRKSLEYEFQNAMKGSSKAVTLNSDIPFKDIGQTLTRSNASEDQSIKTPGQSYNVANFLHNANLQQSQVVQNRPMSRDNANIPFIKVIKHQSESRPRTQMNKQRPKRNQPIFSTHQMAQNQVRRFRGNRTIVYNSIGTTKQSEGQETSNTFSQETYNALITKTGKVMHQRFNSSLGKRMKQEKQAQNSKFETIKYGRKQELNVKGKSPMTWNKVAQGISDMMVMQNDLELRPRILSSVGVNNIDNSIVYSNVMQKQQQNLPQGLRIKTQLGTHQQSHYLNSQTGHPSATVAQFEHTSAAQSKRKTARPDNILSDAEAAETLSNDILLQGQKSPIQLQTSEQGSMSNPCSPLNPVRERNFQYGQYKGIKKHGALITDESIMAAIVPKMCTNSQIRLATNRTNRISRRNVPFATAVLVEYENNNQKMEEKEQVADIIQIQSIKRKYPGNKLSPQRKTLPVNSIILQNSEYIALKNNTIKPFSESQRGTQRSTRTSHFEMPQKTKSIRKPYISQIAEERHLDFKKSQAVTIRKKILNPAIVQVKNKKSSGNDQIKESNQKPEHTEPTTLEEQASMIDNGRITVSVNDGKRIDSQTAYYQTFCNNRRKIEFDCSDNQTSNITKTPIEIGQSIMNNKEEVQRPVSSSNSYIEKTKSQIQDDHHSNNNIDLGSVLRNQLGESPFDQNNLLSNKRSKAETIDKIVSHNDSLGESVLEQIDQVNQMETKILAVGPSYSHVRNNSEQRLKDRDIVDENIKSLSENSKTCTSNPKNIDHKIVRSPVNVEDVRRSHVKQALYKFVNRFGPKNQSKPQVQKKAVHTEVPPSEAIRAVPQNERENEKIDYKKIVINRQSMANSMMDTDPHDYTLNGCASSPEQDQQRVYIDSPGISSKAIRHSVSSIGRQQQQNTKNQSRSIDIPWILKDLPQNDQRAIDMQIFLFQRYQKEKEQAQQAQLNPNSSQLTPARKKEAMKVVKLREETKNSFNPFQTEFEVNNLQLANQNTIELDPNVQLQYTVLRDGPEIRSTDGENTQVYPDPRSKTDTEQTDRSQKMSSRPSNIASRQFKAKKVSKQIKRTDERSNTIYLSDYKKSGKSDILSLKKTDAIKSTIENSKTHSNQSQNEKDPKTNKEPPLSNNQFFDCQDFVQFFNRVSHIKDGLSRKNNDVKNMLLSPAQREDKFIEIKSKDSVLLQSSPSKKRKSKITQPSKDDDLEYIASKRPLKTGSSYDHMPLTEDQERLFRNKLLSVQNYIQTVYNEHKQRMAQDKAKAIAKHLAFKIMHEYFNTQHEFKHMSVHEKNAIVERFYQEFTESDDFIFNSLLNPDKQFMKSHYSNRQMNISQQIVNYHQLQAAHTLNNRNVPRPTSFQEYSHAEFKCDPRLVGQLRTLGVAKESNGVISSFGSPHKKHLKSQPDTGMKKNWSKSRHFEHLDNLLNSQKAPHESKMFQPIKKSDVIVHKIQWQRENNRKLSNFSLTGGFNATQDYMTKVRTPDNPMMLSAGSKQTKHLRQSVGSNFNKKDQLSRGDEEVMLSVGSSERSQKQLKESMSPQNNRDLSKELATPSFK